MFEIEINTIRTCINLGIDYEMKIQELIGRLNCREDTIKSECEIEILPFEGNDLEFIILDKKYFFRPGENKFGIMDEKKRKILVDCENAPGKFVIHCQDDFNVELLLKIFEWCLHIVASLKGIAFVHGMAFGSGNGAYVFPAWKGTGKTTIFFNALNDGMEYIADDWFMMDKDLNVFPYYRDIFLYRKDINELGLYKGEEFTAFERIWWNLYSALSGSDFPPSKKLGSLILKMGFMKTFIRINFAKYTSRTHDKFELLEMTFLRRSNSGEFRIARSVNIVSDLFIVYKFEHSKIIDSNLRIKMMLNDPSFIDDHHSRIFDIYREFVNHNSLSLEIPVDASGEEIYMKIKEELLANAH